MILVLLGTNPYPFTRLVNAIFEVAKSTDKEFFIQSGNTPLNNSEMPANVNSRDFLPKEELVDLIKSAGL